MKIHKLAFIWLFTLVALPHANAQLTPVNATEVSESSNERSHKDQDEIERLDAAWQEIEKSISDLGELIRSESKDLSPQHRYEGYKRVLAMLAENYVNRVQYDSSRPEVSPQIGALFNHSAPGIDFLYRMVRLEPGATYRARGNRGEAEVIDFQFLTNWWGEYEGEAPEFPTLTTTANVSFDDQDIKLDSEGNFEFIMSSKPRSGQWWQIDKRVNTILIREYFTDYATQGHPADLYFDRIEFDNSKPTVETIDEGVSKLMTYSRSLKDWSSFLPTANKLRANVGDNQIVETNYDKQAGATDQNYFLVRYNLKPTEALVGQWTVPDNILYWGMALYDQWWAQLNYGNRQVNLNKGLAKLNHDRVLYFIISHQDPGIANWLDLDGHQQGIMMTRTKGARGRVVTPEIKLVPFADIDKYLPANIDRVTPEERMQALAVRRSHFHKRERR